MLPRHSFTTSTTLTITTVNPIKRTTCTTSFPHPSLHPIITLNRRKTTTFFLQTAAACLDRNRELRPGFRETPHHPPILPTFTFPHNPNPNYQHPSVPRPDYSTASTRFPTPQHMRSLALSAYNLSPSSSSSLSTPAWQGTTDVPKREEIRRMASNRRAFQL